ncbi:MAG TPA: beta-ketoacyl synthase N-terminal-like domain-containing protein, partial [Myxococcales bacterium]|nr:beta-ketoacyl synthase N-terminal-like domain-containing protein [Myxococcales bacterium]
MGMPRMTTIESRLAHLSDSKRALLAKMMRRDEPSSSAIAVVGMACRFPGGANDPESFWGLMRDGRDPVQEVPADRWDVERYYDPDPEAPGKICTRWAGMLDGIDQFDASLFGISQSEAEAMDPQQRILLEVAWEALESAGYAPLSLSGSRTGVYVGLFHASYGEGIVVRGPAAVDAHSVNGIMHCSAVGRLSFLLGLEGPCVPVNTACSSSLVAVHQACRALQSGEADMALAGGVNVLHSLHWLISLCKLHVISPDGRCRAFDASANGMVEAEGAGLLVLKRLQDAQAAGDRVLALVRGSAVNHNGRSASLTAPSGRAQRACIRAALKAAGVSPAEVSFLEAQGTATPLGDSIEVSAAAEVLNEGRRPEDRIWLTSVKANIGHAEAASGVAGLIKVILAMQHQAVPPQLHFRQLHPDISFGSTPFAIPTRMEPWPRSQRPRLAGVSGFGMSGTNAHVVLEEPPVPAREARAARPRHLLCLSAQTEPGLRAQVERYRAHLEGAEGEGLGDLAFTANAGRSHLRERLAVTAGSAAELGARLSAFLHGEPGAAALRGRANAGERVKVAFVFSGAEGLRPGLGKALYDSEPAFRRTVDACAEAVRGLTGASLVPAVFSEHPLALRRPALYALQCALCETWRSWGVVPEAVLGHGAGELAAACASGALSLEDGARLSADLEKALPAANFGSPAIPLFSSQSGGEVTATLADHLRGALREPQELQRSLQAVLGRGVKALLELGPHHAPSLLASVPADKAACIPSLLRGEDDWEVLLGAAGALYAHGAEVDFRAMDRPFGHRTAPAPTYAFQRRRYWLPPSPEARGGGAHPLLRTSIRTPRGDAYLEGELQGNDQRPWVEYRVRGALLLRAAAALQTMLSAAAAATSDERWALHGVKLEAPAAPGGGVRLQAMVGAESGEARRVELYARPASGGDAEPWAPVASAELRRAQAAAGPPAAEPKEGTEVVLDGAACHELLGKGDERAPGFRLLEEVRIRGRTAVG